MHAMCTPSVQVNVKDGTRSSYRVATHEGEGIPHTLYMYMYQREMHVHAG